MVVKHLQTFFFFLLYFKIVKESQTFGGVDQQTFKMVSLILRVITELVITQLLSVVGASVFLEILILVYPGSI